MIIHMIQMIKMIQMIIHMIQMIQMIIHMIHMIQMILNSHGLSNDNVTYVTAVGLRRLKPSWRNVRFG